MSVLLGVTYLLALKWRSLYHKNRKMNFNDADRYIYIKKKTMLLSSIAAQSINMSSCFVSSKQQCHPTYSSGFHVGYSNRMQSCGRESFSLESKIAGS